MPATGAVLVSLLERRNQSSQAALTTPDPLMPGKQQPDLGEVQCGCLGEAGCVRRFLGREKRTQPGRAPTGLSVARPGVEPHRGLHRRLEIWQAYRFKPNRDSEGESESRMGVGRSSPFIYCSQRLFFEVGAMLPASRMLRQACLGLQALWKRDGFKRSYPRLSVSGDAEQMEASPFLKDCLVVPEARFLFGCCKVIK